MKYMKFKVSDPADPYIIKILIQAIFFILLSSTLHALTPVIINENIESVSLGRHVEILEDPTGKLNFDDVIKPEMNDRWYQSKWDVPNFGFTRSTYWFRFVLIKSSDSPVNSSNYILELAWPLTNIVELHQDTKGDKPFFKITGNEYPLKTRSKISRNFIFDLNVSKDKNPVYIKMKSKQTIQLPLYIWDPGKFALTDKEEGYIFGGFIGILFVMILYNFFIYIAVRDKNYLFYIMYISSQLFYNILYTGIGQEMFWPDQPEFNNLIFPVSISLVTITAVLFVKFFLDVKTHLPALNKIFLAIIVLSSANIISPFLNWQMESIILQNLLVISGSLVIVTSSFLLLSAHRTTKIFFLSWIILLSSTVTIILKNYGFIPNNIFTRHYVFFAIIIETTLLSFALADRINIMKREKEDAQNDALRIQKEATESLERKVTERTTELAQANEKLRDLDHAKNDFIANISHELRTPLTLMIAPVEEAISGKNLNSETLEMMQRNGRNLLSLINDLLDVSRLTAGRMTLEVSETGICAFVKQCCGEMESSAKLKNINLICKTCETELNVFVDPERMAHVISNFFSNSFKFTDPGGEIDVSVSEEDGYAVIKFSDTGCGIEEDKISIIFDRFSQADTGPGRKYEGTGIGLSIVKELVELHAGGVYVESRHIDLYPENHGTTFTVKLLQGIEHFRGRSNVVISDAGKIPAAAMPYVRGIEPAYDKNVEPGTSISGDSQSILVVEDNSDLRRLLVDILGNRYSVYEAASGNEAVKLLDKVDEIDLVLSDIMMPGMDGHELLKWIRADERYEGLPVVFLTARADSFMKIEGLDLGAIDYVTKPFSSEELILRIRNQMEQKKLRNSLRRNYENISAKLREINVRTVTSDNASKIETICAFIRDHYTQELTRENLASAAGLNPDTFSRMFNQQTGKTLFDYINELRVNEAKRKLGESGDTITRICIDTGFDNIRTFNRVFKKQTGLTPGEFRVLKN